MSYHHHLLLKVTCQCPACDSCFSAGQKSNLSFPQIGANSHWTCNCTPWHFLLDFSFPILDNFHFAFLISMWDHFSFGISFYNLRYISFWHNWGTFSFRIFHLNLSCFRFNFSVLKPCQIVKLTSQCHLFYSSFIVLLNLLVVVVLSRKDLVKYIWLISIDFCYCCKSQLIECCCWSKVHFTFISIRKSHNSISDSRATHDVLHHHLLSHLLSH